MPTRLLICDDSSFAQKQLAMALPENWPVEVTFAKDGAEGLQAIKDGKGEVVFLDLTMPDMDGYQVLKQIQTEKIKTNVIVISGDVQPDAYRRVTTLGALDFIKKPVEPSDLVRVLDKFGLRKANEQGRPNRLDVSVDIMDGYREISNVAMGRAADSLARLLDCFVVMPIPKVNLMEVGELRMLLESVAGDANVSTVCQGFIGNGIAGEALLMFNATSFKDIAELMKYEGTIDEVVQLELLMDIASVLVGAVLKGLADQLDINFSQSHPAVLSQGGRITDVLKRGMSRWKKTLTIEMSCRIEGKNINSDVLLVFTEDSIPRLSELVAYIIQ